MGVPWNNWYHCMGHTFGTWLPGSKKGFRTRHHRLHVEGDYKNPPPPGTCDVLYNHVKANMTRDPVYLNKHQQQLVLKFLVESLQRRGIPLRIVEVDRVHFHLLIQLHDRNPRKWVGIAKKESSHYLKLAGCGFDGGIWAVRGKEVPIENENYWGRTVPYIRNHVREEAVVWEEEQLMPSLMVGEVPWDPY